jgi:hypothetical protein
LLFLGFVAAAAVSVLRGAGARSDVSAGAARAGVAAALYFAIHGSADWFWEFPGLAGPALAWIGLAAAREGPVAGNRPRATLVGVVGVVAVVAALSMIFPWLSEVQTQRATRTWAAHSAQAFDDLDSARSLNPLSTRADIVAGAIASRLDLVPQMRLAFARAVKRDDRNWYSHFELGIAEAALGHRATALRQLAISARLNPREPVIGRVRRLVRQRRPIDRARIDKLFIERVETRVGP